MADQIRELCMAPNGQSQILQGNIAFAVGCVRGGIHSADGYPGTPSSEVIDRGLSQVQDLIEVGWSVNEAVASAVGHGHTLAGRDCVVTMKIPGLFQAADIFTSGALYTGERGALIYYIASDFTPSSTQHTLDPRYLFKSCFVPVFEPRNHQELHESAAIAAEIARAYKTQIVVMPNGNLCHSEGLVHLMPCQQRQPIQMPDTLKSFMTLPGFARKNYDIVLSERMPALVEMVEKSPFNHWDKGSGKTGVITYGINDMYLRDVQQSLVADLDILSLGFTNPLPLDLIRQFCNSIHGEIFVIEDGYRYLQEAIEGIGFKVTGKGPYSTLTEWSPALIAEKLGLVKPHQAPVIKAAPVARPPVICAGCPYRLFANEAALLKKKKQIDVIFGDIGCNTLLFYMNSLDTAMAMGASEGERTGYVISRPEQASRCLSVLGDSTECHTGMDATRNTVYRNIAGVKVILDNEWTGMTGGQPSPTSPTNLAGQPMRFDLPASLSAHGANVMVVGAYEKLEIRKALKTALAEAKTGSFTTIVLRDGSCIQKTASSSQRVYVEPEDCKKCNACLICPGLELDANGIPQVTNLCSGCGGHTPACVQSCPTNVLKIIDLKDLDQPVRMEFSTPPQEIEIPKLSKAQFPKRLSLAIRGVGGQGNLFFGTVLAQLAFLAGYDEKNIIKGETHGMAQMGGPVISTFACGEIRSPLLLPGTVDCLIAMEKSEVLRPGFLEMLKSGGTILLASTKILPLGLSEEQYPSDPQVAESLKDYHVTEVNVLAKALELGDASGRIANVVMMGVLSTLEPFNVFPPELWLNALKKVSSRPVLWASNYLAFNAGRSYTQPARLN
ncbi:MAG TPA: 2-oxoacid:acceptor oxidoreductase family protein [Anaerolineaceae bacterium]|nr:2-oxoacid:acceptor oxidoreductase family protein [Anaerolineaceae bacterium]